MNQMIIDKLKELKSELQREGIVIIGIFGSYARGDYTQESDIDILYEIENPQKFIEENNGWGAFTKLAQIKEYISNKLDKRVDFVSKDSLNRVGKKYILQDLTYV